MHEPLVSIVIPCYNGATTIVEAIQSALAQTYSPIEIIVVDDGSNDNSAALVRELMVSVSNISLYQQENKGSSAARNCGLKQAKGEYVVFLDADDRLKETYLSLAVSYYKQHPETTIVYSNMEMFERERGIFPLSPFEIRSFLRRNCIPAFAMVRTAQIKIIGGFDEHVSICVDWECWIHLLKRFGGKVYRIEEPQYYYRKRFAADSVTDGYKQNMGRLKEMSGYVFFKHQTIYEANNMGLTDFYRIEDELLLFKRKYYNRWYRKLFYKLFKPKKYVTRYQAK